MKDGKKIEKVIRLIQETLKDSPYTKIYSNYKIENISGSKREIDILIVSVINSMEIKIAIECKNYNKPVPVDKIEAFNSKCLRIKGISKKVFVSASGYQSDALKAAKDFDIEPYFIDEISKENINGWFPIYQVKPQIKIKVPLKINIDGGKDTIKKIPQEDNLIIHYFPDDINEKTIPLIGYIWNTVVVAKQYEIRSFLLANLIQKKNNEDVSQHFSIPFSIDLKGVYILDNDNNRVYINRVASELDVWLEKTTMNISDSQLLRNEAGGTTANTLTLDIGENEKADLIIANDNLGFFYTDSNGKIIELKPLAKYDPKTDNLEIFDKKNEG